MTTFAHRVLVGVDASVGSREAVDTAIELCRATGAELHLVHVKLTSAVLRGRPPGGPEGQRTTMREEGEGLLRRSREYAERQYPVTGTHLRFGQRVDRVLSHAQDELEAPVLVIGASHAGATGRTLGRTVTGTVRRAPGSVLVARHTGAPLV